MNPSSSRPRLLVSLVLVPAVAAAVWYARQAMRPDATELLQESRKALALKDVPLAQERALAAIALDETLWPAWQVAGDAAVAMKQFDVALNRYGRIPDDGTATAVHARFRSGQILLNNKLNFSNAEQQFLSAHKQDPRHPDTVEHLAYLYGVGTRYREQVPFLLQMIRDDQFSNLHLYLLATQGEVPVERDRVALFAQAAPGDPLPVLAQAGFAVQEQDFDLAIELLSQLTEKHPKLIDAQARLGHALAGSEDVDGLLKWNQRLPDIANDHPRVWSSRGTLARLRSESAAAIRCYWEAIRRDPNDRESCYQLGRLLWSEGRKSEADHFLQRAANLQNFASLVDAARSVRTYKLLRDIIETAQQLGLQWEAWGWTEMLRQIVNLPLDAARWSVGVQSKLLPQLSELPLERCAPGFNPTHKMNMSDYPLPDWILNSSTLPTQRSTDGTVQQPQKARIKFVDAASASGISFQYFNGGREEPQHMYEFTGGGVACIDFDCDGWPDIHLPQGADWPVDLASTEHIDALYRNNGDEFGFQVVTLEAGLSETGFSQGVAVGDFNSDGFPDLYIGNIGPNRLYLNNGDGTFTDATPASNAAGNSWTTSCAMADFNNDGLCDIYAVNYLADSGEPSGVFARVCPDDSGVAHACPPNQFPGATDRLMLNSGDGSFTFDDRQSAIERTEKFGQGRGLGVIVSRSHPDRPLSIFVANDASPNFMFHRDPETHDFAESALELGLALNGAGRAEACMGAAWGDADGDGTQDLFVTNFEGESNTLYLQKDGLFVDATQAWGLRDPSVALLGFGTQFLDADLDGRLDLLIANGHVNDLRNSGSQFRMRPQYFSNVDNRGFSELSSETLGPYFAGEYLGRGLAILDWNRDGRTDAAISNLDAPTALLTNETEEAGHFLSLHLRGVKSSRDAIGAVVTVEIGERRIVRQLSGGNGYQASNQRLLVFGLGSTSTVDRMWIDWPSGQTQLFQNLTVDRELVIIENRNDTSALPE